MIKKAYENPESELLTIQFEGNILSGWDDPATKTVIWGDDGTDNGME